MHPLPVLPPNPPDTLAERLARLDVGEIRFDRHHRMLYATDASNYQVEPLGVVFVRDPEAMGRLVAFCGSEKLPLLLRGGGTSLAGQCTNRAIVADHTNRCRRLLAVDPDERTCVVEPGIGVEELNRQLTTAAPGLFFAPDPATSAQAAVGGCIGNNAAGARSIRYGRTSENIAALQLALSTGEKCWIGPGAGARSSVALRLARGISDIVQRYAALIRARFPKTVRRNAGYGLDMILAQLDRGIGVADLDLTGLICGSEGTLAAVLRARLKLHPIPRQRGLAIVSHPSIESAIAAVPAILQTRPSAVELLDEVVLQAAAQNTQTRGYLDLLPQLPDQPLPRAVLYVEYQSETDADDLPTAFDRLRAVVGEAPLSIHEQQAAVLRAWALRKAAEPLVHNLSAHRKPVTLIEDNAIPVENLAHFVAEVKRIVAAAGTFASYYAHASVGVLHIRPMLDLHEAADRQRMQTIAQQVAELARQCGGVMSGEHGDGRVRGPLLEAFYGPELMRAFAEVKALFDPAGVLNPHMIVSPGDLPTITEHLRVHPHHAPLAFPPIETYFDYSDQESFGGALEMCNGAGVCRKLAGGAMCPSYRATLDERHTTRGRANALRLALSGQLAADEQVDRTLDLCLSCKACKSECPSNVDLARLKAEYTAQQFREGRRVPFQARFFGHVRTINRLGSMFPRLSNFFLRFGPTRALANQLLNLAPERSLPPFAPSLYQTARLHPRADAPKVVLYADCFGAYNEPHIAHAAIAALEKFGYTVLLPKVGCCGRAMVSCGLLPDSIRTIDHTLAQLQPYIDDAQVHAILFLEPSCLSAVKDEWLALKLQTPKALRAACAAKSHLVEEFLELKWGAHPAHPAFDPPAIKYVYHAHCHQKSLWGSEASVAFLRRILGDRVKPLDSGCCGMAGQFGFTRNHFAVSKKIFNQSLPDLSTPVIAAGTSCRHQVRDLAKVPVLHPIEILHS